jgi:hypothetical protein
MLFTEFAAARVTHSISRSLERAPLFIPGRRREGRLRRPL